MSKENQTKMKLGTQRITVHHLNSEEFNKLGKQFPTGEYDIKNGWFTVEYGKYPEEFILVFYLSSEEQVKQK